MADTSSRCVLIKGLSHDATEQDLMKCLDKQNLCVLKVHSHTESRTDKRWVVLFSSSEAARECIRQGSWKVNLPSGEIIVTPDYCSECIVPDDWIEKHEVSDEESSDESWIKLESPASEKLHKLSGSFYSYSNEEPDWTPVHGADSQTANFDTQDKFLQLAVEDDTTENFTEEIYHCANYPQDRPQSEKMTTDDADGGQGNYNNSDKSHASEESHDLSGRFNSYSTKEPNLTTVQGADGQTADVDTQEKLLQLVPNDDTIKNFPESINQDPRFSQDRPQSEKMRPEDTDGGKGNHANSDRDEMFQVAYFQDMVPQSQILISGSPKMIDHGTDYTPLKSGSIAMGIAKMKYTTDTSHSDSQEDVTKHIDDDKIQTKRQGTIKLSGRHGHQSLVGQSVNEDVCKQNRDSQKSKKCGHEKPYLPNIGRKENVVGDEDENIEDLNHAMRGLNIKDEHVSSQPQKENSTKENSEIAWTHENPSVHNERSLSPQRKSVNDKTIKIEVLQSCTGISAQGLTLPEPQPVIEGYQLNLTMPQPSQGMPSQDMTMKTSHLEMPQPYAEVSFERLTVSQPNTDIQLPNMGMPNPITGLPIQSMHIPPVTSWPVNPPYIDGQVYSVVATGQTTVSRGTGNYMVPPHYAGHYFYNPRQTMPSILPGRLQMNYGHYGWLHQSPPFTQQHVPATFSQPSYPTSQASFMYSMHSPRLPLGFQPTEGGFSGLMGPRDNAGQMASVLQTSPVQEDLGCVDKTRRPQTITNAESIQHTNTTDRYERVTVVQDLEMRKRDESELNEDRPQSHLYPKLSEDQFQFSKDFLENKSHPDRVNLIDSQRISHDHRHDVLEGFESDKEASSNAHMDNTEKVAREIESKPQEDQENVQTPRMIRVMGLAKSVSKDALELFFENKKRCGGGEIETMEWGRSKREAFITFKDPSVVQSVLEKQKKEPFYLEKMKLTVDVYVPPPPDPLRLFLKNLSPKVTHELLILYLESRCNATPTEIFFGRLPGTALVTFSEPPDVELLLKKVKERPLEGQNIQVVRVPVTSSIQLSGLPLSSTRDTIELYFENPKRSGGGPVKDVKFARQKQSCVVSFKHSEDAKRVCSRPHTIDKKEIQVCLYYECLDGDLNAEEFADLTHETEDTADELKLPAPIELKDFNPQILRFLMKNEKHRHSLEKNLLYVNGIVKWPSSVEGYVIIECAVKMEDKSASSVLKDWSTMVVEKVNSFAVGIEVVKFSLLQKSFSRVIERLQTVTIDNPDDLGVFVEQEKNDLTVVGPKAAVEKLKKTILDIIAKVETQIALEKERVTETKQMKPYEMTLLRETHFKQNIEKVFPGLQFELNQKDNKGIFVGQADVVQKAVIHMHEKLQSFVSSSMPLSKAAKGLLFIKEVTDYIKQKMKSQKVIGVWDVDKDEVQMFGQDKKEVQNAIQFVRGCFVEKEISLDDVMVDIVQEQQWSRLIQRIQEKYTRKVVIESSLRSILVVAVDDIFQDVFDEINVYLEKHSVEELFLALDPMRVKFIRTYKNENMKALEKKFESSHVKLSIIDYVDKNGIKINGTRDVCSVVKTELAKMANTVITKEHRMVSYKEGLEEFLQSYKVRDQLSTIEKRLKCFMVMKDSSTSGSLQQEGASGGHSSKSEGNADQSYEPMDWQPSADSGGDSINVWGIKVSVVQGELAKQKVDVIVNSASHNFDLNNGAVSKTILKYGGDTIQSECRQQYHSGFSPGQVVVTSGGMLHCKKVYHGCLGTYSSHYGNSIELMKTFVMNCLTLADNNGFQSMAFPALGTGNLGFPADEVVKLMLECIQNFGKKTVYTTLKSIALVVYPTDKNVIKAFTAVLGGTTVPSASAQRSASSSSNISTVQGICKCTLPNLVAMEILPGDITKETTDVIVNSVMCDLNLDQGQVSKAILTAGGSSIQQECQGKDADWKKHGYVVTYSGRLLCKKIIHMAAQDEDHKWKDIIKRVLIETEQLRYKSISFPALGTGGKGLSPEKIAQVMYSACTEFAKSHPLYLKKIRVVLFQKTMLTTFVHAITVHNSGQVSSNPVAGKSSIRESKQSSLVFNITADSEFNVQEAVKDLEGFVKRAFMLERN